MFGYFFANLETVRPYRRPYRCPKVLCLATVLLCHQVYGLSGDMERSPFPPGVHRGNYPPDRIIQQYRHAVGSPYPDRNSGKIRHERIKALQFLACIIRPVNHRYLGIVHLMPLDNRIWQLAVPSSGKRLHTLS